MMDMVAEHGLRYSIDKNSFINTMTYRENINILIKRLRRIQLVSLLLMLMGVVLTIVVWNVYESDQWYCKVIILIGVLGEFYCWVKVRQIKCPQCGKNLGYLLLDPSYSKTNGAILLPKELPPDRHCCAYCKASFDVEMDA